MEKNKTEQRRGRDLKTSLSTDETGTKQLPLYILGGFLGKNGANTSKRPVAGAR